MTNMNPLHQLLTMPSTRREFLSRSGTGLGSLGLASLFAGASGSTGSVEAASVGTSPMVAHAPQYAGKAKHVIHIFLNGGPSHVDTFDPKPSLTKYHGQTLPTTNLPTERKTGPRWGLRTSSRSTAKVASR